MSRPPVTPCPAYYVLRSDGNQGETKTRRLSDPVAQAYLTEMASVILCSCCYLGPTTPW